MGKGAGKLYVMKSQKRRTIIIPSISNSYILGRVTRKTRRLTMRTYVWKMMSLVNIYGCLAVLVRILRMMRPLLDP